MKLKDFNPVLAIVLFFGMQIHYNIANAISYYSLRVRPLALASSTYGAEVFFMTSDGFFAGPTFHYFIGNNLEKKTALKNLELGLKFGKIFQEKSANQGFFIMGNINYYKTSVAQFNANSSSIFRAEVHEFGEALFAGYQWCATLIGTHWDLRLGIGIAYKPEKVQYFDDTAGNNVPVGVRKRVDPTLEFTMGYVF